MTRRSDQQAAEPPDPARRDALKKGAMVLAGAAAAGVVLRTQQAQAAKASQAVAMYQPKPHGQQECNRCVHFIPGKTATAIDTCQVVAGSISPHGWCVLFGPKA